MILRYFSNYVPHFTLIPFDALLNKRQGSTAHNNVNVFVHSQRRQLVTAMLPLLILVSASSASPINISGIFNDNNSSDYCYTSDQDPYLCFGTKTAYEYTRGDLYNDQLPDSNTPSNRRTFMI